MQAPFLNLQALEAKKRVLDAELERRFQEAKDAISDEVQARKLPLDQAVGDITRSNKVLESALEALEDKLKEPQHEFIQRFVPMIEVSTLLPQYCPCQRRTAAGRPGVRLLAS